MNLVQYRTALRLDLKDSIDESQIWTEDDLDRAIEAAISDLNEFMPRERVYDATLDFEVSDEDFTSDQDAWVSLANTMIEEGSETIETTDGATEYTRDTDYEMDYANGQIKVLSTGDMSDDTEYHASYNKLKIGIDISDIADGLIRVIQVEYPTGKVPRSICSFRLWGDYMYVESSATASQSKLSDGDHVTVFYHCKHTVPTETAEGTYSTYFDEILLMGALSYALLAKTMDLINDSVTAIAAAETYLAAGDDYINEVPKGKDVPALYAQYANSELQKSALYQEAADRYRTEGLERRAKFLELLKDRSRYRRDQSSSSLKQIL